MRFAFKHTYMRYTLITLKMITTSVYVRMVNGQFRECDNHIYWDKDWSKVIHLRSNFPSGKGDISIMCVYVETTSVRACTHTHIESFHQLDRNIERKMEKVAAWCNMQATRAPFGAISQATFYMNIGLDYMTYHEWHNTHIFYHYV